MRILRIAAVGVALAASAQANAQQVEPIQFTLDNGMEFMLYPRTEEPNIIAAGWLASVSVPPRLTASFAILRLSSRPRVCWMV